MEHTTHPESPSMQLSRLGMGCMRLSMPPGAAPPDGANVIRRALDAGVNFLNTGDFYGENGHNEYLVGEAIQGHDRDGVFISLKYGTFGDMMKGASTVDVGPKNVKKYITASLRRLKVDYVDLYQPARVDIGIPLEDTIGAMSRLVEEGYVRTVGLSEVDADTLRRAHAIHPIHLVEMSYSVLDRSIEAELLPTARDLGIGVVAFGAMGFGRLAKVQDDVLFEGLGTLASEKNTTVARLAHAWLLAQGTDILPLVGARSLQQLEDSLGSLDVELTKKELAFIDDAHRRSNIAGRAMPSMVIKNGVLVR